MSSTIIDIRGRQILDSRGNPTVEVDVTLEGEVSERNIVNSLVRMVASEPCIVRREG